MSGDQLPERLIKSFGETASACRCAEGGAEVMTPDEHGGDHYEGVTIPDEHGGDHYGKPPIRCDFSVNLNPLGMPPGVREAVLACPEAWLTYPDPRCHALRQALAAADQVRPEQIICGNGSSDLIYRYCLAVQPRRALILAPTFSEYEKALRLAGCVPDQYPLRADRQFDLEAGIVRLIEPGLDVLILCNPNNPTGRLIAPELLRQLAQRCAETKTRLLIDECFLPFCDAPSALVWLTEFPGLAILRALTKTHGLAGVRLGYLASDDQQLLLRMAACGQPWSVSGLAQVAGLAALRQADWLPATRRLLREARAELTAGLARLGLEVLPGAANFVLVLSRLELAEPLLRKGFLVRRCANFSGLDRRDLRLAVRLPEENRLLLTALAEILAWLPGTAVSQAETDVGANRQRGST